MDTKRGRITANITPERIREALDAGLSVHVVGYDTDYDTEMGGRVQSMDEWPPIVFFREETVSGPFYGKRVGLAVKDLTHVTIA
jgi:hypothetical protein